MARDRAWIDESTIGPSRIHHPMNARPFTILIDGRCTLCRREAAFVQRLDHGRGLLRIVDITLADFDPAALGTTMDAVMGQIHGIAPDGTLLRGMEVFRRAYGAVGKRWLLAWTAWPILRPIVDQLYLWFARHRVRISALAARVLGDKAPVCDDGRCATKPSATMPPVPSSMK